MRHQLSNQSSDSIAWIGSITTFLQLLAGGIGGPLFDRFGTTWVSDTSPSNPKLRVWLLTAATRSHLPQPWFSFSL